MSALDLSGPPTEEDLRLLARVGTDLHDAVPIPLHVLVDWSRRGWLPGAARHLGLFDLTDVGRAAAREAAKMTPEEMRARGARK